MKENNFATKAVSKLSIGFKIKAVSGVQPEPYILYFED
jgi:hypothetical protein